MKPIRQTQGKQRLHVFLSHAGIASRRKAEALIAAGNVKVNGKTIKEQGMQINPDKDTVFVDGKFIVSKEILQYFLAYKPRGVVSSVCDPDGKRTVLSVFRAWWRRSHGDKDAPRVYPVGRLDEESEGLMLLTNDGDSAYRLTHPKFGVQKVYHVLLKGSPTNTQLHALEKGVKLKEGFSTIDAVSLVKHDQGNTWISLTLHQGFHRQVRRTCAQVGLEILALKRVVMGPLKIGTLSPGNIVEIEKPSLG